MIKPYLLSKKDLAYDNVGFEIYEKTTANKFNKEVEGVIIRIDTNKITNNTD